MKLKFLKDLVWVFSEHGVRVTANLIGILTIVNYLPPSDYGNLSIALTILGVCGALASLGLDSILFRDFIEDRNLSELKLSIVLRFYSAIVVSLVVLIASFIFEEFWLSLLVFLVSILFIDSFLGFKEFALAGKKYKLIAYSTGVASVVQLLSIVLLVNFEFPIEYFYLPYVLYRLTFIIALVSPHYLDIKLLLSVKCKRADYSLLRRGFPMMIASLSGIVYAAQDQWMIGYYMGPESVGIYSAQIKFILILLIAPTLLTNVLYHKIISNRDSYSFSAYIQSLYSRLFYLGFLVFIFINIFSGIILPTLLPPNYVESILFFNIYSIVLLLGFFQALNNKLLNMNNLQSLIMKRVLLSMIANFMFNVILIPTYGLVGAASATVLSEVIIILTYYINNKTKNIFWYQLRALDIRNVYIKNY